MSLDPNDDRIGKFKRSYQGYLDNLNPQARQAFEELIDLCYPYLSSIIAKGEPFEDEPVEVTIMLVQHLIIKALKEEDSKAEELMEALRRALGKIESIGTELEGLRNIINEAIARKKIIQPASEFQTKLEVK